MAEYVISGCSSADLSKEWMEKRKIEYIEFHFELGDKQYMDDFGVSVPPHELYQRMLNGEDSKTSQIGVGEYTDHFRKILSSGKDLIHVTLSTGITGTYNSAVIAANEQHCRDEKDSVILPRRSGARLLRPGEDPGGNAGGRGPGRKDLDGLDDRRGPRDPRPRAAPRLGGRRRTVWWS